MSHTLLKKNNLVMNTHTPHPLESYILFVRQIIGVHKYIEI